MSLVSQEISLQHRMHLFRPRRVHPYSTAHTVFPYHVDFFGSQMLFCIVSPHEYKGKQLATYCVLLLSNPTLKLSTQILTAFVICYSIVFQSSGSSACDTRVSW